MTRKLIKPDASGRWAQRGNFTDKMPSASGRMRGTKEVPSDLEEAKRLIYGMLRSTREVTEPKQLKEELNIEERVLDSALLSLSAEGLIRRIGKGKKRRYLVDEKCESVIERMAKAIKAVISRKDVLERIGDWEVDNDGDMSILYKEGIAQDQKFGYFDEEGVPKEPTAHYSFDVCGARSACIRLKNTHRECTKGAGTPTLKVMEKAFQKLADESGKKVEIEFEVFSWFDQPDTRAWLQKNNYEKIGDSSWVKTFEPGASSKDDPLKARK